MYINHVYQYTYICVSTFPYLCVCIVLHFYYNLRVHFDILLFLLLYLPYIMITFIVKHWYLYLTHFNSFFIPYFHCTLFLLSRGLLSICEDFYLQFFSLLFTPNPCLPFSLSISWSFFQLKKIFLLPIIYSLSYSSFIF